MRKGCIARWNLPRARAKERCSDRARIGKIWKGVTQQWLNLRRRNCKHVTDECFVQNDNLLRLVYTTGAWLHSSLNIFSVITAAPFISCILPRLVIIIVQEFVGKFLRWVLGTTNFQCITRWKRLWRLIGYAKQPRRPHTPFSTFDRLPLMVPILRLAGGKSNVSYSGSGLQ